MGRRKNREASGLFLVEGWRSVMSAATAGATIEHVFVSPSLVIPAGERGHLDTLGAVFDISDREMARLSDVSTPPGVLAVVRQPDLNEPDPWPDRALLLDGIQDPGNVGTLIRTAAWLGIDTIAIGPGTADPFAPKVVRSTMGGLWDVHILRIADLSVWLERRRVAGSTIWMADMEGTSVEEWHPSAPSVLVIGNEAHGVSDAVRRAAQGIVSIRGGGTDRAVESLNAAVAGAIIMSRWTHVQESPL